jgi:hypothetical protein
MRLRGWASAEVYARIAGFGAGVDLDGLLTPAGMPAHLSAGDVGALPPGQAAITLLFRKAAEALIRFRAAAPTPPPVGDGPTST